MSAFTLWDAMSELVRLTTYEHRLKPECPKARNDADNAWNAREELAELIHASKSVECYLTGDYERMRSLQNAANKTRAQLLREQADDIDRKETAISRFRVALAKVQP